MRNEIEGKNYTLLRLGDKDLGRIQEDYIIDSRDVLGVDNLNGSLMTWFKHKKTGADRILIEYSRVTYEFISLKFSKEDLEEAIDLIKSEVNAKEITLEDLNCPTEFNHLSENLLLNSRYFGVGNVAISLSELARISTNPTAEGFLKLAMRLQVLYIESLDGCSLTGNVCKDFQLVLIPGAKKYDANQWLNEDGSTCYVKHMVASIFRHIAESMAGHTKDHESGLHPLLHAICRCMMMYTRLSRGIIHPEDK